MKCPNCYSPVPGSAAKCPRCDWSLKTPATPTSSAAFADSSTADAWGSGSSAAPTWTPEPQRPQPAWDEAPPEKVDSQGFWDSTGKANWNPPAQDANTPRSQFNPGQGQSGAAPLFPTNPTGASQASAGFPVAPPPVGGAQNLPFTPPTVVSTVPLSGGQKVQLWFIGLLPLTITGGLGIFFFNMTKPFGRNVFSNLPWFFPAFIGLILLVLLYQAFQNIRDAASGTANVQRDRLERTQRVRNRNSVTYYAYFANLGKMRVSRAIYDSVMGGMVYDITYSPATKRVWAMRPGG